MRVLPKRPPVIVMALLPLLLLLQPLQLTVTVPTSTVLSFQSEGECPGTRDIRVRVTLEGGAEFGEVKDEP